jgi:hypothetical protein
MSNHLFRKSKEKGFNDVNFKLIVSKASWFQDKCGIFIIIEWICLIYFSKINKLSGEKSHTWLVAFVIL